MNRVLRRQLIDRAVKAQNASTSFAVYVLDTGKVVFRAMQNWVKVGVPDDKFLVGVYKSCTVKISEVMADIEAELTAKGFA